MIIKIVTISLMAVFYICYFAKLISQKKQGIKTDQLGKGKEGFVKFIEVALKIITYLLPCYTVLYDFSWSPLPLRSAQSRCPPDILCPCIFPYQSS